MGILLSKSCAGPSGHICLCLSVFDLPNLNGPEHDSDLSACDISAGNVITLDKPLPETPE